LALSVGLGIAVYRSIDANVAEIEFYRLGQAGNLVAAACGAAVCLSVVWALLGGMWRNGAPASATSTLAVVVLIALGNLLLVTGCGYCLTRAARKGPGTPWYVSMYHPAANVMHDQTLLAYFVLSIAFTRYLLALLPPAGGADDFVQNAFPAFGVLAALLGYAKLMKPIGADFVKREAQRASTVIQRRYGLSEAQMRPFWQARAASIGRRFDLNLRWAMIFSAFGLVPTLSKSAWSVYVDPSEAQRGLRAALALPWLPGRSKPPAGASDDTAAPPFPTAAADDLPPAAGTGEEPYPG
jgi:hypothetical protein